MICRFGVLLSALDLPAIITGLCLFMFIRNFEVSAMCEQIVIAKDVVFLIDVPLVTCKGNNHVIHEVFE